MGNGFTPWPLRQGARAQAPPPQGFEDLPTMLSNVIDQGGRNAEP